LGTVSMIFEYSFVLQEESVDTLVLRSARAAKIGARAGRLLKVMKGFALCMRTAETIDGQPKVQAQVLARRLTQKIAGRVSLLTIGIVVVMPLFELITVQQDRSMEVWAQRLEENYKWTQDMNNAEIFESAVDTLDSFFEGDIKVPFEIDGWDGFQLLPLRDTPQQRKNIVTVPVEKCVVIRDSCDDKRTASIKFNYTALNQWQAAVDILVLGFILCVMVAMTADLRATLDKMLVRPLEGMMASLQRHTEALFNQFCEDEEDPDTEATELEAIERTLTKISRIAGNALKKNAIDEQDLSKMTDGDKGVLVDMMNVQVVNGVKAKKGELDLEESWPMSLGGEDLQAELELQSWDINTLELQHAELAALVKHIFFKSKFGLAGKFAHAGAFEVFMDKVKPQYMDVPYHCYPHAVDVLHTVWRLMNKAMAGRWLNEAEQYGLLVAAYCHDLGHFGKTNPFLVESENEMALRYNDKSPLENMHCAKLFEICKDTSSNAFGKMSRDLQKESRKICVATILHTDNVNHAAMVKDIEQVYEMQEEVCDRQARIEDGALLKEYKTEVLEANKLMWMELFLHFADVSNPLKPFTICYAWAQRVLDEFFAQGDEEKARGLPVGILNDREKVNRPGSQHGFISFLVAPLVKTTVLLFPMNTELHVAMSTNLSQWRNLWLKEARPSDEELAKKDEHIWSIRVLSEQLEKRKSRTDWRSWQPKFRSTE